MGEEYKLTIFLYDFSLDTLIAMSKDLEDNLNFEHRFFYDEEEIKVMMYCKSVIDSFIQETYGEEVNEK